MKPFDHLIQLGQEIATLQGLSHLLRWDQETVMPKGAASARALQNQLITKLTHEKLSGKAFEKTLSKCIDISKGTVLVEEPDASQKAALRKWRDDFLQASTLPPTFMAQLAALVSEATEQWRLARPKKSFSHFAPFLERLVEMTRQKAEYLGYQDHPYDALLDEHEKGATTGKITPLFQVLKEELIPLRQRLKREQVPEPSFFHRHYPPKSQLKTGLSLPTTCLFGDKEVIIDLTSHPFCASPHPTDVWVSTRIQVDTPIRLLSDEISYPLHIALRYDLEKELIGGELAVRDLPQAWNGKMVEYLHIEPKDDSEGCLQDIHWAFGFFGYFPTYTLGNLYAAQFFEAFKKTYPNWEERIARGDFAFMCHWLKEHLHLHGRKYTSQELIKRITGHPLMAGPYPSYLKSKYQYINCKELIL